MATASVKVALRVRPMTAKELLSHNSNCINCIGGTNQVVAGIENSPGCKSFTFDHVYDRTTPQEAIYSDCILSLVDRLMEGFNATVLAYGHVNAHCFDAPRLAQVKPIQWESDWKVVQILRNKAIFNYLFVRHCSESYQRYL